MYRELKELNEEISNIETMYYKMIKCGNSEDLQDLVSSSTRSTINALKAINHIVRKMDEQYNTDKNFNR
jgi:hypothetical protein